MNRRSFIGSMVSGAAGAVIAQLPIPKPVSGMIYTPANWTRGWRLFVDGVDVTDVSDLCDTGEGWVQCFPHWRDTKGRLRIFVPSENTPDFENEVKYKMYGKIEIHTT